MLPTDDAPVKNFAASIHLQITKEINVKIKIKQEEKEALVAGYKASLFYNKWRTNKQQKSHVKERCGTRKVRTRDVANNSWLGPKEYG